MVYVNQVTNQPVQNFMTCGIPILSQESSNVLYFINRTILITSK